MRFSDIVKQGLQGLHIAI